MDTAVLLDRLSRLSCRRVPKRKESGLAADRNDFGSCAPSFLLFDGKGGESGEAVYGGKTIGFGLVSGETESFPSGRKGRGNALRFGIFADVQGVSGLYRREH